MAWTLLAAVIAGKEPHPVLGRAGLIKDPLFLDDHALTPCSLVAAGRRLAGLQRLLGVGSQHQSVFNSLLMFKQSVAARIWLCDITIRFCGVNRCSRDSLGRIVAASCNCRRRHPVQTRSLCYTDKAT